MDQNKSLQESNSTYNNNNNLNTNTNSSLNNQFPKIEPTNQNYNLNLPQSYGTTQTQVYASAYSTSLTQSQPQNTPNTTTVNNNNNGNTYGQNENISQKRSANDEIITHKRPRITSKIDLRILLPSKDAGAIIGRGGNNIKRLRTEHRTIIQVPDCDGPERLLLIGGETDAALETLLAIIPLLEDNQKYNNLDFQAEVRMLLHQSQAGCIIGRSGDKIKDLRLKHNLDMKVYSDCCPQSTERVCQMKGRPNDILNCMREILDLLDAAPPKGVTSLYDPINYQEQDASNYGGFVSERKGHGYGHGHGRGRSQQTQSSSTSSAKSNSNSQQSTPTNAYDAYNAYAQYYGYNAAAAASMNTYSSTYNTGPITSTQVTIPNRLAGAIIGPRGTKIQSIREQSQAGITIDKPQPGSDDRIITITGTQEQIQNAQYLLQMTVKQSGLWHGN